MDAPQEDEWPEAQGYTPLNSIYPLEVMWRPDDECSDDSNDSNENHGDDHHLGNPVQYPQDYQTIAERAIQALQLDYELTIRAGAGKSTTHRADQPSGETEDASFQIPTIILHSEEPFVANFDESNENESNNSTSNPHETNHSTSETNLTNVDLEAVQRAVQRLSNHGKIQDNYQEWQAARIMAPRTHAIIPDQPLSAFRKATIKAKEATKHLTRAATIAEAVRRLDLLQGQECLHIHIVGADHVECETIEITRRHLAPLVRWISAAPETPRAIHIDLIGPNVSMTIHEISVDLMPSTLSREGLESATAQYRHGVYEETLREGEALPSLIIAFNAGIWGYREWEATIQFLARTRTESKVPFVTTAYTLMECEDDHESIMAAIGDQTLCKMLWEPQANPYASRLERQTSSAVSGRIYRENGAWQAWEL